VATSLNNFTDAKLLDPYFPVVVLKKLYTFPFGALYVVLVRD
jgi:hypothetical protein